MHNHYILVMVIASGNLVLRNDIGGSNAGFFNRSWVEYRRGFGNPYSHYWIGLDRLHEVTKKNCKVRFDLELVNGSSYYAQYSSFSVGSSSTNYTLAVGGYSGNIEDAMAHSNGRQFTTYDFDNDAERINCARLYGGGFWFGRCAHAHITTSLSNNFIWYHLSTLLNSVEVRLLCS